MSSAVTSFWKSTKAFPLDRATCHSGVAADTSSSVLGRSTGLAVNPAACVAWAPTRTPSERQAASVRSSVLQKIAVDCARMAAITTTKQSVARVHSATTSASDCAASMAVAERLAMPVPSAWARLHLIVEAHSADTTIRRLSSQLHTRDSSSPPSPFPPAPFSRFRSWSIVSGPCRAERLEPW
jgi:hypothetical protein